MQYTISNSYLTLTISSCGAELQSIKSQDNTEYMWQADERYWKKHAPNLFPYIGRFSEGKYTYKGNEYKMPRHGFIIGTEMKANKTSESSVVFSYTACERTHEMYPFDFTYIVSYELKENEVEISYIVENNDTKTMYFGIGGHPAFNVPIENNLAFEDYWLELDATAKPILVKLNEDGLVSGETTYEIKNGKIPLKHNLFDNDAIILKQSGSFTKLCSSGTKSIYVSYPDMEYVGFWHMPKTDAPYVCVEPWTSLCSRAGIVEDLETQPSLVSLESGKKYTNTWSIKIS